MVRTLLQARWRNLGVVNHWSFELATALVWAFNKAPNWLQMIGDQGGDEDWIVYVANDEAFTYYGLPSWVEAMDSMRSPKRIDMGEGAVLYVATHA